MISFNYQYSVIFILNFCHSMFRSLVAMTWIILLFKVGQGTPPTNLTSKPSIKAGTESSPSPVDMEYMNLTLWTTIQAGRLILLAEQF